MYNDGNKNLFFKIVQGDKSDNINPLMKKCSKETIEYYYENQNEFEIMLKDNNLLENYKLNKTLISFTEIPDKLKNSFIKDNQENLDKIIYLNDSDFNKK